jgi:hypothetical protein
MAEVVRRACVDAARRGYEDAAVSGLCHEGAVEASMDASRMLDIDSPLGAISGKRPAAGGVRPGCAVFCTTRWRLAAGKGPLRALRASQRPPARTPREARGTIHGPGEPVAGQSASLPIEHR